MGPTWIAVLLALAAALMIGIGHILEQQSARQVTDTPVSTRHCSIGYCTIAVGG
ncbi:hypothetical protein MSTO_60940 [Mycobacterium stomatepiae]|uniref:Uncharacterized protein n=1 Tax=Mycobacterium stomatepiae TaxID=470076 RepID=A0A7I7QHR6_9MYCO|nr:hypothetical protein MSTO_60940 [Mycobacterium stomatepiae]